MEVYKEEVILNDNVVRKLKNTCTFASKRFDFVIKIEKQVYVIETNFYSIGGSKLNETARSYKMLAEESKKVDGVTFVWFTDGLGWKDARRNLEETFNELETMYNINDLEKGIIRTFIQ